MAMTKDRLAMIKGWGKTALADGEFNEICTLAQQALSMQETLNIEDEPSDQNYPHRRRNSLAGDAIKASQQSIDQQGGEWKTGKPENSGWYWVRFDSIEFRNGEIMKFNGEYFQWACYSFTPGTTVFYYSIPITIPPMPNQES